MALQKVHTTIPLGAGLQTNLDDKLVAPGSTLELQNCRQGRLGEVIPRLGTRQLGNGLVGSAGTLPASWALATLNDALVSFSGVGNNPVGIYSPTADQWGADTGINGAVVTAQRGPIFASTFRVSGEGHAPDVAYSSGYYFVTYYATNAAGTIDVHEQIIDATTGSKVADRTFSEGLATMAVLVRVVNGYAVFIRYTTASDIAFDAWQISNLDAGPTTTVFATTVGAGSPPWDAAVNTATTVSLVYQDNVGNFTGVDFAPATAVTTVWILRDAGAALLTAGAVNWSNDFGATGFASLSTYSAAQGVREHLNIPTSGATRTAATSIIVDAGVATPTAVVSHTTAPSAAGTFTILYIVTGGVKMRSYTAGVLVATRTVFQVQLRSKTFTNSGGYFVLLETATTAQETRYVFHVPPALDGQVVAKVQVNGAYAGDPSYLSQVVSSVANKWTLADTALIRLAANPTSYTPYATGIELVTVAFDQVGATTYGAPRETLNSLFVPGGTLRQFDGRNYSDAGFLQYPGQPGLVPGAAGSLTVSSTYYYAVVYARTDLNGRLWRSAPSITTSVVLGPANNSVTVTALSFALADRSDIKVEFYRGSANNNAPLQLVGTVANTTAASTVVFVDTISDATQASGEFLYTTGGGVLANDPIPGFSSVVVAGNRLFGVSLDEPDAIWPSAPFVPGIGLRFSESTKFYIRDEHGPITGLAALPNGVVVAFKGDAVYAITGDGPDSAGRGAFRVDFIAIGLGSVNPRAIVETSQGAEFLSTSTKTGWYLIDNGLNPKYIGGPVQRYVSKTIVGAVLIPSLNEVRYYTSLNGVGDVRCLIHDTVTGLWSIDISSTAGGTTTAATAYGTNAAFAPGGATGIWVDSAGYGDGGGVSPFATVIATPWFKMADLRGYERMYRARGVGKLFAGDSSVRITVAMQKNMIETNVVLQSAPTATLDATQPWEMRYSAKFESVRFVITSIPALFDNPEGLAFTAIVLEYGIKQGLGQQSSGRRTT